MKRARKLAVLTAASWAFVLAIIVVDVCPLRWWHPYCNSQADGPAYAAYGFPLPYMELTGISSVEYLFMPHIYILNVAVMALVSYSVGRRLSYEIANRTVVGTYSLLICGTLVLGILIAFEVWIMPKVYIPTQSIANTNYDSYLSYRPWPLARLMGNRPCEM
jgi:hypothetical protein